MKIPTLPFTVTDWSGIPPTVHPGRDGAGHLAHLHDWRSACPPGRI